MTNQENLDSTATEITSKRKRRHWVKWVALLAFLIAIGSWFQLVHQQKRSIHNYSQLQDSFNQTQSDTVSLTQQITNLNNQLHMQNDQLQALQTGFDRIQAANSAQELDLAIEQVDRYLQQANLSLTFNHDVPAAISLLKAADQRLSVVPNTEVVGLRQAIAKDLVQLKAIPDVDYVGVLSKLTALRDQVTDLPLFAISDKTAQFNNSATSTTTSNTIQTAWDKTLATLKSLVIIRHRHQEISPLVSPAQEQFLRLNLQLIFQQAQWAVLQHNQDVYAFSLTQANEWLQRYFAANDKATLALAEDIKSLQAINLEPKTPNINNLIDKLHQIKANPNKIHPVMTPTVPAVAVKANAPVVSIGPSTKVLDNEDAGEAEHVVVPPNKENLAKPATPEKTATGALV